MTRNREHLVPLAIWVGTAVLTACLLTLTVADIALHVGGRHVVPVWELLVAGGPMALIISILAAVVAARFARVLRLLRGEALRRLHDPSAPVSGASGNKVPGWAGSEMAELARTLEALHMRVRMADEVGERHRRSAETASAGMFELLAGLVAAEEGARGQLSAELHDTVAQSLMAARSMLADRGAEVGPAAELIAEAEEQVRAVMARTRPPALRDGDLARAVAALRDDMENRYGLVVDLSWPTEAYPLPLATAVTVYRFFQEGLLNVVKHSDVDGARGTLRIDDEWVVATVADDGPGFDPEDVRADKGRHVGLGLLRERARLVGGSLEVTSWPAQGATLSLRLPRGAAGATGLLPMPRHSVA
jgi:signal transduction histidine kinase